jgi:cytochrome c551/c552
MRMSRIFAGLVVLVALLVVAASAYGLTLRELPTVPHPAEGMEDCLVCHDLDQEYAFPADHEGRGNELCLACHQVEVSESIPAVPHTTEGREDCVACHATGSVEPFPVDHEGRESISCLACHQAGGEGAAPTAEPTATLPPSIEVVPTPIHEPVMFEENSCISCHKELGGTHEQITADWAEGVHAQQGVGLCELPRW